MRIASAVVIEWDQDQSLNDIFGINEVCWTTAVSDGARMFCIHWGIAAFYQDKLKTVRGQTIINTKLKKKNSHAAVHLLPTNPQPLKWWFIWHAHNLDLIPKYFTAEASQEK